MRAPAWLHDVVGEDPSAGQLAATLAFALPTATVALVLASPPVASWRVVLAWLLLADIAAGCVANFTRSTNDFYAARPRQRLVFIAVHLHLPVFGWLVGASESAGPLAAVWGLTIVSAFIVNALAGRDAQVFVGGLLLSIGLVATTALTMPTLVRLASALFLTKVAFSFAVDHFRRASGADDSVRALEAREHDAAVTVIARAFVKDPLFVSTCGDDEARRRALASFLLDLTRVMGGWVRARSLAGRLVAVSLVDRPVRGMADAWRYALVVLRMAPVLVALGPRALRRLNEYFVRSREGLQASAVYLTLVAVDPDAQGRGIGGELIVDAIELATRLRANALALDTENPNNVSLYRRYGFEVVREVPLDSMSATVMRRSIAETRA